MSETQGAMAVTFVKDVGVETSETYECLLFKLARFWIIKGFLELCDTEAATPDFVHENKRSRRKYSKIGNLRSSWEAFQRFGLARDVWGESASSKTSPLFEFGGGEDTHVYHDRGAKMGYSSAWGLQDLWQGFNGQVVVKAVAREGVAGEVEVQATKEPVTGIKGLAEVMMVVMVVVVVEMVEMMEMMAITREVTTECQRGFK